MRYHCRHASERGQPLSRSGLTLKAGDRLREAVEGSGENGSVRVNPPSPKLDLARQVAGGCHLAHGFGDGEKRPRHRPCHAVTEHDRKKDAEERREQQPFSERGEKRKTFLPGTQERRDGQIGNQPSHTREGLGAGGVVVAQKLRGLLETAAKVGFGFGRDPHGDEVLPDRDRKHCDESAGEKNAVLERRKRFYQSSLHDEVQGHRPTGADRNGPRPANLAVRPHDHIVLPKRHPVDPVPPLYVGGSVVPMREDENESTHVRVDLAENAHDTGPVEAQRLGTAFGVAPKVEALRLREREHVVVDGVAIRKLHRRANGDGERVRDESLFALMFIYLREETTDRIARVAFVDAEPIARYPAVEDMKEALIWH